MEREANRRAFERHRGILQDVLTMILLRWIAVAAVLLGVAALTYAGEAGVHDVASTLAAQEGRAK